MSKNEAWIFVIILQEWLQPLANPTLSSCHINNYTPLEEELHEIFGMIMVAVKSLKKALDRELL